jgi:hypothetical protein
MLRIPALRRRLRFDRPLSISELAQRRKVSKPAISELERHPEREAHFRTVRCLADALEVRPRHLMAEGGA